MSEIKPSLFDSFFFFAQSFVMQKTIIFNFLINMKKILLLFSKIAFPLIQFLTNNLKSVWVVLKI